ncbi:MAG TPA: S-layer homology domain-containing protein [Nitrospirae bacterium]|nr:S-layer homology domain-containing protein [Nitrospirota bacterium]
MTRLNRIGYIILVVILCFTVSPVFAFDSGPGSEEIGPAGPGVASPFPPQSPLPNVFGTHDNILQIPASAFRPRDGSAYSNYSGSGYMYPSASGTWWAPVTLPAGANVSFLDLYFSDTNASSNITAYFTGYYGGDYSGTTPSLTDFVSTLSSGSGGYGYAYTSEFSHTINNDVAYNGGYQYVVNVYFPVADGTLKFKGVDIWWNRQISPAPGTATFSDVPTTHPFFQEIEALAASGITTGYGDGTFRPTNYVTRQAMAAFLSRALGLHWED